jgi:RNA polymerase sigma-70 factor (ECF subfamily)
VPPVPRRPIDGPASFDEVTVWALRAQGGDRVAEAAFVRATQAEVWRLAAALVDPGTADDLTQETYLRAFRALPAFQARSSARTWLLGIARRACADHLRVVVRRRRLEQRLAAEALVATPTPEPGDGYGSADLIAGLPDERRSAFVLTQLLGLSYAEAAEVESVPIGTIRSRVARARDELAANVTRAIAA